MKIKSVEIYIHGVLKGFGYIAYVYIVAKKLGISGYVEYVDSDIHIVAEGAEEVLLRFIEMLKENPTAAIINSIEYKFSEVTKGFTDFRIVFDSD